MTCRAPLLGADDPRWSADLRAYRLPDGSPIPIFAALASCPAILTDLQSATRTAMTGQATIRFREVLILRVCALQECWPEWEVHVLLFAEAAGLSTADCDAVLDGTLDTGDSDSLAMRLASAAVANRLDDVLWQDLCTAGSLDQVIEWVALAGQYVKVCWLSNALNLPKPSTISVGDSR